MENEVVVNLFFPERLIVEIKRSGLSPTDWVIQAVDLGLIAEDKKLFQKIGNQYLSIVMRRIDPYPEGRENITLGISNRKVALIEKAFPYGLYEWLRRVVMLRVRAEGMMLFVLKGNDYVQIGLKDRIFLI